MYARMTKFHVKREKHDEAIKIYRDSILTEARAQNGYVNSYFLSDRNSGRFIAITIWQSIENAVDNEKSGYFQAQLDKFENLTTGPAEMEGYVVSVND